MISQQDILYQLNSFDPDVVLSGVRQLAKFREVSLEDDIVKKLIDLLGSDDKDIRAEVAVELGIHQRVASAIPKLVSMLRLEKDDYVLGSIIRSLTSLISALEYFSGLPHSETENVLHILASITQDNSFDNEVRGTAYANALRLAKKISMREYAAMEDDISMTNVDWQWVKNLRTP